jgi:two-component system LytT family response regulator
MSEMLRAVVVDDEPLAREGIIADLGLTVEPRVHVAGVAANAFGALDVIRRERPDVLFIDIEMPEMNGFDLLARLEPEDLPAAVIVVTAHNEYALRGFDANALDFLLKPYSRARLQSALQRAVVRVREAALAQVAAEAQVQRVVIADAIPASGYTDHLLVGERDRRTVLPVQEIEWIEGQSYYARVHAPPRSWLLRERMRLLESALDPAMFARTHRSAIVRLGAIAEIRTVSRYELEVQLKSGAVAPLAQSRRDEIEKRLRVS